MDTQTPNKYELHKEKKAAELERERQERAWRKTRRIVLWLSVGLVLVAIIFAVNYSFSSRGGASLVSSAKAGDILKPKADDWAIGNPKTAKVVLVEYSDFECPACAVYHPLVKKLIGEFPDQLAFVYRHYPWFFHPHAKEAALVAEAAGRQGKFWEMSDLLFAEQDRWAPSVKASDIFLGYATKLGLDTAKFQADLKDPALAARVQRDLDEAKVLNVTYTPSFFLGNKLIDNPRSYDDFKALIQKTAGG